MPALSDAEVQHALGSLPGWSLEGGEITRRLHFRDFVEAFGFIAQVGLLQEQLDHHARITNTWADVTLALSTHSEHGITERDFELARRINERAGGAQ